MLSELRSCNGKDLSLPMNPTTENLAAVFVFTSSLDLVLAKDYAVRESYGVFSISIPSSDLRSRVQSGGSSCRRKAQRGSRVSMEGGSDTIDPGFFGPVDFSSWVFHLSE